MTIWVFSVVIAARRQTLVALSHVWRRHLSKNEAMKKHLAKRAKKSPKRAVMKSSYSWREECEKAEDENCHISSTAVLQPLCDQSLQFGVWDWHSGGWSTGVLTAAEIRPFKNGKIFGRQTGPMIGVSLSWQAQCMGLFLCCSDLILA